MKALIQPLLNMSEFQELSGRLGKKQGIIQISGCMDSQKAHLLHGLSAYSSNQLIILADDQKAKDFYEDYRFYAPGAKLYPGKDLLFYRTDIHGNQLIKQRMQVVKSLLEDKQAVVITSMNGCMDSLRPLERIKESLLHFQNDSVLDLDKLKQDLVSLGYERVAQVEMSGQFSVRGGIVDIYPLTEENPWRIELWGDEIDSIRTFDVENQRSLENLEEITVYPADEIEDGGKMVSFLEYFPAKGTVIYLDEPNRLTESATKIQDEFQESMHNRAEKGYTDLREDMLFDYKQVCKLLNKRYCAALCTIEQTQKDWKYIEKYDLTVQSVNSYNNSFELLVKDLAIWKRKKYQVVLLSGSRTRASRLAEDLRDNDLSAFYTEDYDRIIQPGEIMVVYGHAHKGFEYPLLKFVVITESDIFGHQQKKRKKRRQYSGQKIQDFAELSIGDYVVHENHGLGIYRGIEKVEVDKVVKDYIKIEYSGKSNLYILATQLDALQKYAGADAKRPRLNKLGGQEWNRTKSRVKGAVQNIAKDLVELYAVRQETDGYSYGTDTVWQKEFEEMFPYEETEDQLQAIEDTKRDMESHKIMDRLICGDVGYGKTEIAIRAAFKAIQEGKQVAYLVPTTILAQQHYNTFVQRMKDFPVRVDLLCRFRNSTEQKKSVQDLQKGWVDIVIGTHRILSDDVKFKDLGLLIVDEEQRFGVTHKEKIKKLKKNVDVLTLTATPI
ncbi:MAG: CarD family transcriptional regulator, partial [Lachnospiraceae bacterium]|nr:CarD family transcriptional regulator [Lachnospiraceae bacterium]